MRLQIIYLKNYKSNITIFIWGIKSEDELLRYSSDSRSLCLMKMWKDPKHYTFLLEMVMRPFYEFTPSWGSLSTRTNWAAIAMYNPNKCIGNFKLKYRVSLSQSSQP